MTIGKDRDRYRQEEKAVWRITEKMIKVVKFGGSSLAAQNSSRKWEESSEKRNPADM